MTPGTPRTTTPMTPGTMTPGTPRTTAPMTPGTPRTTTPPFIYETAPMTPGAPQNGSMPMTPSAPQNGSMPSMPIPGMPMPGMTMPMTPGAPQNGSMPSMPMPGMQMPSMPMPSMQMPGMQMPMTPGAPQSGSMPMPGMPYETPAMPYMGFPGYTNYQGIPNASPYNVPMGIPLLPLYGYDNSADLDRDVEYMKQLYPNTAKKIQSEIDNECDQLEYDGSVMFDEYPDKESLEKIVDRIYEKIGDNEEASQLEMNSFRDYPRRRRQNHLRDIISLILLNEIFNRRRRHRSRRRWF